MKDKTLLLIASGDLRLSANQNCWAEQEAMEAELCNLAKSMGYTILRAHAYDLSLSMALFLVNGKGWIYFQRLIAPYLLL